EESDHLGNAICRCCHRCAPSGPSRRDRRCGPFWSQCRALCDAQNAEHLPDGLNLKVPDSCRDLFHFDQVQDLGHHSTKGRGVFNLHLAADATKSQPGQNGALGSWSARNATNLLYLKCRCHHAPPLPTTESPVPTMIDCPVAAVPEVAATG